MKKEKDGLALIGFGEGAFRYGDFKSIRTDGVSIFETCFDQVSVGRDHILAIRGNDLFGFGSNVYGQITINSLAGVFERSVNLIANINRWSMIAAGDRHSLAVSENRLYAWGWNDKGQLGDALNAYLFAPTFISKFEKGIDQIEAKKDVSFLLSDGELYMCGDIRPFKISWGGIWDRMEKVETPFKIKKFSVGHNHILFLTEDGGLYSLGWNDKGQLGVRDDERPTVYKGNRFYKVTAHNDWEDISAGHEYSLGILGGVLYGWGNNENYQLGEIVKDDRFPITKIGIGSDWEAVKAGVIHSVGVKNGDLYTWGNPNDLDLSNVYVSITPKLVRLHEDDLKEYDLRGTIHAIHIADDCSFVLME